MIRSGKFFPLALLSGALLIGCSDDPSSPGAGRNTLRSATVFAPVETLSVPVDGTSIVSGTVLEAGVTYRLRASGTAFVGIQGDSTGDAEYADFSNVPASLVDACEDTVQKVDLGLAVDDGIADSLKTPHWGDFDSDHVYMVDWLGSGEPLSFNYHDCDYGDNSGTLTVEILAEVVIELHVDIKPGSDRNPINLGSQGVTPVAILGSDEFDCSSVDVASVQFGPGGAYEAHGKGHREDVNEDGWMDLVLHFRTQELGLSEGDTQICITGWNEDGVRLEGCDSIVIVPPDHGGD